MPKEVQLYFDSELIEKATAEIQDENNLPSGLIADLIIDFIVNNYDTDRLEEEVENDFNVDEARAQRIVLEILGKVFLPVDRYLHNVNIEEKIKYLGGESDQYKDYIDELIELVENERFLREHNGKDLSDVQIVYNPDKEKEDAIMIFRENLTPFLYTDNNPFLKDFNFTLIQLMSEDKQFQNNLIRSLFANLEKVTHKKFLIDNKPHAPSVRNWLKSFIKVYGSGNFDNLTLSNFITNADNAKILNDEERAALKKLLLVYRNTKFFAENFKNLPPEKWEIFPVEKEDKTKKIAKKQPISAREEVVKTLKGDVEDYPEGSLEREVLEEEKGKEREIQKLLLLAAKYKPDSLEYRAIQEEIKKLEKQQ